MHFFNAKYATLPSTYEQLSSQTIDHPSLSSSYRRQTKTQEALRRSSKAQKDTLSTVQRENETETLASRK